jgi:pyruvate-ferredoxin/flavodoxin oxidoreductase
MREFVIKLKKLLSGIDCATCKNLLAAADSLIEKSVWALGGDGWAYDIGYGGLDHVLASGENINILVLDTEVYSNTGGQASKATPLGAVAKFAASGKKTGKKDLTMMAMSYGYVYVAKVALGADPNQVVKVFNEAEKYNGPSLIVAYSHCIAHGINMTMGLDEQKKAVQTGHWQLFRYNPDLAKQGRNPLIIDSKTPDLDFKDYAMNENRYKILSKVNPAIAEQTFKEADVKAKERYSIYKKMSEMEY